MLPQIVIQEVQDDCRVLLERALLNQPVCCFGADGNGQYGTSYYAKHFTISQVAAKVIQNVDEELDCIALLTLDGYDVKDNGHAFTDENLRISLNKLFDQHHISGWKWGELHHQGADYVGILFSVPELLAW